MNRTAESYGKRNEELFMTAVEYLAKKYRIDTYTLVTKGAYHVEAEDLTELEVRKKLLELFQK